MSDIANKSGGSSKLIQSRNKYDGSENTKCTALNRMMLRTENKGIGVLAQATVLDSLAAAKDGGGRF